MRCIWHQGEGNPSQESTLSVSVTLTWSGVPSLVMRDIPLL